MNLSSKIVGSCLFCYLVVSFFEGDENILQFSYHVSYFSFAYYYLTIVLLKRIKEHLFLLSENKLTTFNIQRPLYYQLFYLKNFYILSFLYNFFLK